MTRVIVFGTGDIARLAHYYFSTDSEHQVVAFTVDRAYVTSTEFLGLPVVAFEDLERLYPAREFKMFVALSYSKMNKVRAEKYRKALELGYELVSYVSSRCSMLTQFPIGKNCFILEDNTIQPYVRIGDNVTLWSGNHIGHDSVIEDHCFISSHVVVSGHCRIGAYSFLGVNATLRNSITLAPETLLGAGAIIMGNTQEQGVYIPERARLFSKKSSEIDL